MFGTSNRFESLGVIPAETMRLALSDSGDNRGTLPTILQVMGIGAFAPGSIDALKWEFGTNPSAIPKEVDESTKGLARGENWLTAVMVAAVLSMGLTAVATMVTTGKAILPVWVWITGSILLLGTLAASFKALLALGQAGIKLRRYMAAGLRSQQVHEAWFMCSLSEITEAPEEVRNVHEKIRRESNFLDWRVEKLQRSEIGLDDVLCIRLLWVTDRVTNWVCIAAWDNGGGQRIATLSRA